MVENENLEAERQSTGAEDMRFGLSGQLVLGGYPCYIWAEGSPAICLETTILLILCFAEPGVSYENPRRSLEDIATGKTGIGT